MSTMARISDTDHERLRRLVKQTGQSHRQVLSLALETYERERILDALNAGFARLKSDPQQWSDELAERTAWEATHV